MAKNKESKINAHDLITLPNMLKAQQDQAKMMHDHKLSTFGNTTTNIVATNGDFDNLNVSKDIEVSGNVRIKRQLQTHSIIMDSTSIIMSIDYNRITENIKHMSPNELNFLRKHLKKVEMMIEKEMFDRA